MASRPYKVWNHDRTVKKSVTAATLAELTDKGRQKLGMEEGQTVRVLLQEDGTEVDEEDYFTFLPHNTTFVLLTGSEQWRPEGSEEKPCDETDSSFNLTQVSQRLSVLIAGLQKDISRIITFSNEDLQTIIDMDASQLSSLMKETETLAKAVQEACQRHLDDRNQATEAVDLLRLYDTARKKSPYIGEKRPRLEAP